MSEVSVRARRREGAAVVAGPTGACVVWRASGVSGRAVRPGRAPGAAPTRATAVRLMGEVPARAPWPEGSAAVAGLTGACVVRLASGVSGRAVRPGRAPGMARVSAPVVWPVEPVAGPAVVPVVISAGGGR
ncbi:hypothetical protein GCM10022380_60710 [Amycolatopsis tucumanensis]|uniref:Uncharacterized protein n=1 Tax=Amycolatopsis tucumanensis TaxID=401106 RepID=A0ABP7J553_9PSEU